MTTTAAPAALNIAESTTLTEASVRGAATGRRMSIQLITPGRGSSGVYSEACLKQAAKDKVFAAGTRMYIDHQKYSEAADMVHGSRSMKDLAATFAEDATWNGSALVVEADVFGPWRPVLAEMADHIGVSIKATGTYELGTFEGQPAKLITSLDYAESVDFVAAAGRGGKILALLESAMPLHEAHGMAASNLRTALSTAVEEMCGDGEWAYVTDYGDDFVIYRLSGRDCDPGLYRDGYTVDAAGTATLAGAPVEVNTQTTYVPRLPEPVDITATETDPPAAPAAVHESTHTQKEGTVAEPTTQTGAPPAGGAPKDNLTEAEKSRITATEAQIAGLQAENAELREGAKFRNDAAVQLVEARRLNGEKDSRIAQLEGIEDARDAVAAIFAESGLPVAARARVTAAVVGFKGQGLPLTEAGALDLDKVKAKAKTAIDSEITYVNELAESTGFGSVRGLGAPMGRDMTEAQATAGLSEVFESIGLDKDAAAVAAKGR